MICLVDNVVRKYLATFTGLNFLSARSSENLNSSLKHLDDFIMLSMFKHGYVQNDVYFNLFTLFVEFIIIPLLPFSL